MDACGIVYLAFFDDQELPLQKQYLIEKNCLYIKH